MKLSHRKAQELFAELGAAMGYRATRTWNRHLPTDGVWLTVGDNGGIGRVPIAAIEVIVSEQAKTMRGSMATLAAVSPAVAVLLVQNHEIRRGLVRRGADAVQADECVARQISWLRQEIAGKTQRFAVWSYDDLVRRHQLAVGAIPRLKSAA